MIRYSDVTFSYPGAVLDSAPALKDVTLEVEAGELLLLAGPSGGGKSTLLRAANGLVPHFSGGTFHGFVHAQGRDTRATKPRDLADVVGFVGQDPEASSVTATVEDEIAFVLENLGIAPTLMRKRVEETLDALSIAHLRERKLDTLSGGERQRVAIAAVLVAAPAFVVLDEPTSQLDPQSAEEVVQSVLRLSHEIGIGILLAEHRLERVVAMADRLAVVDGGVVQAGPVAEMLARSPVVPPVVRLARALGWERMPVSVRDARTQVKQQGLQVMPRTRPAASTGDPRIVATGLRVVLGRREALKSTDLTVCAGETVAIVGRNGAGKTTLLRCIAGLAKRSAGRVVLDGQTVTHVEAAARVAAYVPQHASRMLALASARAEVAQTLRLKHLDPAASGKILSEWDLGWAADRDPRDLSGGEATRLALAAACAADPGIVLLDEPTRGMDEQTKHWLAARLALWRSEGRAVIIVTHDVELVAEAATRVVLMSDGEIVVDGPVLEVLGESVLFSSQMNKVFGDPRIATVGDVEVVEVGEVGEVLQP